MIAVSIVGVLAAVGIQQYGMYTSAARRPEAQVTLSDIWDAQKHYYEDHGEYAGSFAQLNFTLAGGVMRAPNEYAGGRYVYQLSQPNGPQSWYCAASGNIDGDPWLDVLITGVFW